MQKVISALMMSSYPKTLSIDIETYSSVNLAKSGVYKYSESSDFEILLLAYSIDGSNVQVVDIANNEALPPVLLSYIKDDRVIKYAFNANFERVCLSRYLGFSKNEFLNPKSWRCTLVWSAYLGLPLSLELVGRVLNLDKQKLTEGKDLVKFFCMPTTPTKQNNYRTRNYKKHDEVKWQFFKQYNKRDVETELEIEKRLSRFEVPSFVWDEYHLDQTINDRGVLLDLEFVEEAIKLDAISRDTLVNLMQEKTNLDNPNSVMQLHHWLEKHDIETLDLSKKSVEKLKEELGDGPVYDVLSLRQQLAKTSIKKYLAMKNAACSDGRARGMFQFYGANRSGRWAGRLIQVQNLPRNYLSDLAEARSLVKTENSTALRLLYENIPDTLSQLIRTAFIPKKDKSFIVVDFSSIEARILAWISREEWRIVAFSNNEDIYCASASQMFGVKVEKNGENSHLRQKGKIAELALGYGGSVGALSAMGASDAGLTEDELSELVRKWRSTNQNIVSLWYQVDRIVVDVVRNKTTYEVNGIKFSYKSGMLQISLPSGRMLNYVKPKIVINKFNKESVSYEGIGENKKWERIESYGAKFVENIVQGIARDILSYALESLKNYQIVMHIHDEVIVEAAPDELDEIIRLMSVTPPWAKGLLLRAEGFITDFYRKD